MSTDIKKQSSTSSEILSAIDVEKNNAISADLFREVAFANNLNSENCDLRKLYMTIKGIVTKETTKSGSTEHSIKKAVEKIDLNLYKLLSSQTNSDQSNNNKESEKKVTEKLQSNKINNNKDIQNAKIELPIDKFKEEIVEKVKNSQTVIISAETGAGKSTRVAQYLAEQGTSVIITETTKVSTESLTTRVAEEMQSFVGSKEIDYRHGEKKSDSNPKILFCTDGLQLVRELTSTKKAKVLIIDEVHEWNTNIETLIAWSKKRQQEEPDFKLILMSATIDYDNLSKYFNNCPVIKVPGRTYPVTRFEQFSRDAEDQKRLMQAKTLELSNLNKNILVFLPGKEEINEFVTKLKAEVEDRAVVLPLHGDINHENRKLCFQKYSKPKIVVATNIAQTSITIEDIDAVVDSGLEKRTEVVNNVEGLYLRNISLVDCEQRAGRAGRTKPGEYYLISRDSTSRLQYPVPEIQRKLLDQVVLRLATSGYDATQLEFFHTVAPEKINEANKSLKALGAMDEQGNVTEVGHLISKLPCSVAYARMIVEAYKYNFDVVDDVITIASILESGSIRDRKKDEYGQKTWPQHINEKESDLLAELEMWNLVKNSKDHYTSYGILRNNYVRARDFRKLLSQRFYEEINDPKNKKLFSKINKYQSNNHRESILKSCIAGMVDHLYQHYYENRYGDQIYKNGTDIERKIDENSVIKKSYDWIVGKPFDTTSRKTGKAINIINFASAVDPNWLAEVAPQLMTYQYDRYDWSDDQGCVTVRQTALFNSSAISKKDVAAKANLESAKILSWALSHSRRELNGIAREINKLNHETLKTCDTLWYKSGGKIARITGQDIEQKLLAFLSNFPITSIKELEELIQQNKIKFTDLYCPPDQFIDPAEQQRIMTENPDSIDINNKNYPIEYSKNYNDEFFAEINMDIDDLMLLTENIILPSGRLVRIIIKDPYYSGESIKDSNIDRLKQTLETKRLNRSWKDFERNNPDQKFTLSCHEALPTLPQPEVYDQKTNAKAYAGYYRYWSTSHYVKWFQTEQDAIDSSKEVCEQKESLEREERKRQEKEKLLAPAKTALKEVEEIFEPIKDDCHQYQINWNKKDEIQSKIWQIERLIEKGDLSEAITSAADVKNQLNNIILRKKMIDDSILLKQQTIEKYYSKCPLCNLPMEDKYCRNRHEHLKKISLYDEQINEYKSVILSEIKTDNGQLLARLWCSDRNRYFDCEEGDIYYDDNEYFDDQCWKQDKPFDSAEHYDYSDRYIAMTPEEIDKYLLESAMEEDLIIIPGVKYTPNDINNYAYTGRICADKKNDGKYYINFLLYKKCSKKYELKKLIGSWSHNLNRSYKNPAEIYNEFYKNKDIYYEYIDEDFKPSKYLPEYKEYYLNKTSKKKPQTETINKNADTDPVSLDVLSKLNQFWSK